MKRIIFVFALAFLGGACQKEAKSNYPEYYRNYNQALKLQSEGNLQEAIRTFERGASLVAYVPPQHFIQVRNWAAALKDCDLARAYYQKAVAQGYDTEQYKYSGTNCPGLSDESYEGPEFDAEYRNAILEMVESDQAARNTGGDAPGRTHAVDSLNNLRLLSMIKEKGYPNPKIVGHLASEYAFIIMLHFDADVGNKKLKPILDKAYNQGFLSPSHYAWIIDRRRNWGPEKLHPYYYQIPTLKYFDLSEEQIAEIDKRRDSIGLKSLAESNIKRTEDGGVSIQM